PEDDPQRLLDLLDSGGFGDAPVRREMKRPRWPAAVEARLAARLPHPIRTFPLPPEIWPMAVAGGGGVNGEFWSEVSAEVTAVIHAVASVLGATASVRRAAASVPSWIVT